MSMPNVSTTPIVLVVDDSLVVRRQVARALAFLPLQVQEAADGVMALEFIEQHPVAVLITDVNMPRMNGVELLTTLLERGIQVPSLVLTSEREVERLREARNAGALGWLLKPFDPEHLAVSVVRAMARLSVRDGALT